MRFENAEEIGPVEGETQHDFSALTTFQNLRLRHAIEDQNITLPQALSWPGQSGPGAARGVPGHLLQQRYLNARRSPFGISNAGQPAGNDPGVIQHHHIFGSKQVGQIGKPVII